MTREEFDIMMTQIDEHMAATNDRLEQLQQIVASLNGDTDPGEPSASKLEDDFAEYFGTK